MTNVFVICNSLFVILLLFVLLGLLLEVAFEQRLGARRHPVEEMTRFPEPAGVALRAEDDKRHLLTGLRKPQQRREAIARAADESGLAADDVDVAAADDLIRAVRRD